MGQAHVWYSQRASRQFILARSPYETKICPLMPHHIVSSTPLPSHFSQFKVSPLKWVIIYQPPLPCINRLGTAAAPGQISTAYQCSVICTSAGLNIAVPIDGEDYWLSTACSIGASRTRSWSLFNELTGSHTFPLFATTKLLNEVFSQGTGSVWLWKSVCCLGKDNFYRLLDFRLTSLISTGENNSQMSHTYKGTWRLDA